MTGSRGGARVGAGRKPLTLALLVAEGRFSAVNQRHRELLELEDLSVTVPAELRDLQRAYRFEQNRGNRAFLARSFARAVTVRAIAGAITEGRS